MENHNPHCPYQRSKFELASTLHVYTNYKCITVYSDLVIEPNYNEKWSCSLDCAQICGIGGDPSEILNLEKKILKILKIIFVV